jgi:hypothetical protein
VAAFLLTGFFRKFNNTFLMLSTRDIVFTHWLQNHLLPCPFKKLTGVDCPGCGFQRSVIALFKGDIVTSLHFYPATIPIIFTSLFVALAIRFRIDNRHFVKKTLYIITGSVIMVSYIYKIWNLYVVS